MALNGTVEGDAIQTAVAAVTISPGTPVTTNQLKAWWEAFGVANVNHFKNNAVVVVTSVSGVTTGAGTSGSGAGTLT